MFLIRNAAINARMMYFLLLLIVFKRNGERK